MLLLFLLLNVVDEFSVNMATGLFVLIVVDEVELKCFFVSLPVLSLVCGFCFTLFDLGHLTYLQVINYYKI